MKRNQNPQRNNTGLSLIQVNEDRAAMLMKMRGKLAGVSEVQVQPAERRRAIARQTAPAWRWKAGAAAALALLGISLYSPKPETAAAAAKNGAVSLLDRSAILSINDQALYWAYALYDFDRLRAKFGVPKTTVINSTVAADKLRGLLPQVDAQTRAILAPYMIQDGRGQ